MLIRSKTENDAAQCLDLLMQVHESDGYPMYLPEDVPAFITPEYEVAAWVAERDGRIVGHAALHQASVDPTLAAAQRATGLPADRLSVVSRLFTSPALRRAGIGRALLRHATGLLELEPGKTLQAVATTFGMDYNTVAGWRDKYLTHGLGCLQEAPRSGRPLVF